uniref:TctD-like protein n=1 Tax=Antithamnion hubbsii TaxID=1005974 RepID=A0A4D6WKX1_9FLOR|nr:hypothetical protein [Antithamnion hubbsii]
MIVDDDTILLNSIVSFLTLEGFIIYSANNVYDSLVYLKCNKPDLIITDIMMQQLDGYDFLNILNDNHDLYDIPIILLTAKGFTSDRIKGYDLGCNGYLTKPFSSDELLAMINNIFSNLILLKGNNKENIKFSISNSYMNRLKSLTYREETILNFVIKGFTNKEIASHLNLSISNVEKYVSRLLSKTKTRNRTELVNFILNSN